MTVRKATGTTVSLVVLIVGIVYLLPVIKNSLPYEVFYTLDERMFPQFVHGSFTFFIVKTAIWLIIVVGIFDAILRNRVALGLLSSLNIPIVMSLPVIITAFIPQANIYIFWTVLQISVIIGIYWAFRKTIRNNHSGGQKMIPFVKEIKNFGGMHSGHVSDHFSVWVVSLLLLVVFAVTIISLLVFLAIHWNAFV